VALTQKEKPLLPLKRRPYFQTHKRSRNERKLSHGSRVGSKPTTTMLARTSSNLLDCNDMKQEGLGRTNGLLSLIQHGPHWIWHGPHTQRREQKFFYCSVCIRYRGNISTWQLPSNYKGISTESLPSNDRGIQTRAHKHTAKWSHKPIQFFQNKESRLFKNKESKLKIRWKWSWPNRGNNSGIYQEAQRRTTKMVLARMKGTCRLFV
jgi:hypothetical protein